MRCLFWLKKLPVVRNREIELLKFWLAEVNINASVASLKHGDRMKISTGPIKGNNGGVQEINKNRIQLLLPDLDVKITLVRD